MRVQTGPQEESPIPGKLKNCSSWAKYEAGYTGEAAMCNGGHYDGDYYEPCPVQFHCRNETDEKKRRLTVMNPAQPFGGNRIIASTPNMPQQQTQHAGNMDFDYRRWREDYERRLAQAPTTAPARPAQIGGAQPARPASPAVAASAAPQQFQYPSTPYPVYYPQAITPPTQFPQTMQTQYAAPIPFHAGGITPTFLPANGESVWSRLGKNVAQGMIGSTGWHIFDLARTVDFFGR
jgi:hypothetical protein